MGKIRSKPLRDSAQGEACTLQIVGVCRSIRAMRRPRLWPRHNKNHPAKALAKALGVQP